MRGTTDFCDFPNSNAPLGEIFQVQFRSRKQREGILKTSKNMIVTKHNMEISGRRVWWWSQPTICQPLWACLFRVSLFPRYLDICFLDLNTIRAWSDGFDEPKSWNPMIVYFYRFSPSKQAFLDIPCRKGGDSSVFSFAEVLPGYVNIHSFMELPTNFITAWGPLLA